MLDSDNYDIELAESEFDSYITDADLGHAVNDVGQAALIFSIAMKDMGTLNALKSSIIALNMLSWLR